MGPLWAACTIRVALGRTTEWMEAGVDRWDPEAVRDWVSRSLAAGGMTVTVEAVPAEVPDAAAGEDRARLRAARRMRADAARAAAGEDPAAFDRAWFGQPEDTANARYHVTDVDGSVIARCPTHGEVYRDDAYEPSYRLVDALRVHEGEEHR